MTDAITYPRSDTAAGYVAEGRGFQDGRFTITTSAGCDIDMELAENASAEVLRNLDEPYLDASGHIAEMLQPGRYAFFYGVFYPGAPFEVKRIIFVGRQIGAYRFEEPNWWIDQIESLARFYSRAQFGDGPVDFRNYRTLLRLGGEKTGSHVQETDTISRLVYGMASAFMLTGDDHYLDIAENGTEYLREHMRFADRDENIVYWYHGVLVDGQDERKIFASEFGDDYDAIPVYEQIYALAGPIQTYRVTGDPADSSGTPTPRSGCSTASSSTGPRAAISRTSTRSPSTRAQRSLGPNTARKNWNSVGDHAPAYLINLYLATAAEQLRPDAWLDLRHDPRAVPRLRAQPLRPGALPRGLVSHDKHLWQQDRAVVGHNLKIAWNLMRIHALLPQPEYLEAGLQDRRS